MTEVTHNFSLFLVHENLPWQWTKNNQLLNTRLLPMWEINIGFIIFQVVTHGGIKNIEKPKSWRRLRDWGSKLERGK